MSDGMPPSPATRPQAIAAIQSDLTTIARRGSVRARNAHPGLTLASQSLVSFIEAHPGSRAVDVAAHFELDKSTVSRQLGVLYDLGFIERARGDANDGDSSGGGRGYGLRLTEHGRAAEAQLAQSISETLVDRFADWPEDDVLAFAALLRRFNS